MPHNWLPCKVLYGQLHHGQCSAGGQEKWYKDQLKTALKKCNIKPGDLEGMATDRNTWRQLYRDGTQVLEEERTARMQQKRQGRHRRNDTPMIASNYIHLLHLQQDLWIQDRTVQPPKNPLLRQKWMSSSASMDNYKQASSAGGRMVSQVWESMVLMVCVLRFLISIASLIKRKQKHTNSLLT